MKKVLKFQNSVRERIESFALLDGRVRNNDISLNEDDAALTAVLDFDGFRVKIEYFDYKAYRGYNFLEDNKANGECLNTTFIFPFSELEYSIYDVHNAVDDREFVPLEFHTINERQFADEAVDTVTSFISRHIDELNKCSEDIKARLDESFENGVKLASRRLSVDEIKTNKKKFEKHRQNMYCYRYDQSYFINFICRGKTGALQRWLARMSAKGYLFTFEERYFEYLMENDFCVDNEKLKKRLKKNEKNELHLMLYEAVLIVLCTICGGAIMLLCSEISERIFFEGYEKLHGFGMFTTLPLIIMAIAFQGVLIPVVKKLFSKDKNLVIPYEKLFDGKRYIRVIAVIVIILTAVSEVFLSSRCIAVNQDNFYYCDSVGNQKYVEFSDVQLFIVEGWYDDNGEYHQETEYVLVFDKDYDNFIEFYSDDYERLPVDKLNFSGEYKTMQEFEKDYCSYE